MRRYHELSPPVRAKAEEKSRKKSKDLQSNLTTFQNDRGYLLSTQDELFIQAVIQQSLLPVPIRNGNFEPSPHLTSAPVLTADQEQRILHQSRSVGRLELRKGDQFTPLGTAFVAAHRDNFGILATNCHVIRDFISSPSDTLSGVAVPNNLQVNFGETPTHRDSESFMIRRILPCPPKALDVAFLLVDVHSLADHVLLPNPLDFWPNKFVDGFPEMQMGIIGYPNLAEASKDDDFSRLFTEFDPSKYAKFYCPGQVKDHQIAANVDFLRHVASTMAGESGSPLLRLSDGALIGVHACCSQTDEMFPNPDSDANKLLPCAWRPLAAPQNLSISSWTVTSDSVLNMLLHRTDL